VRTADKRRFTGGSLQDVFGGRFKQAVGAIDFPYAVQNGNNSPVSSASTNTKGTYVDLFNPLSFDARTLALQFNNNHATRDVLLDISVGAPGSEVTYFEDLLFSMAPSGNILQSIVLPCYIKAGTRVRARIQSSTGSSTLVLGAQAFSQSLTNRIYRDCETWGAAAGDSGGVSVDPGGSINTKGAYSVLTSSSARRCRQLLILIGNQNNGARTSCYWRADVAVGPNGSEVIILPDFVMQANATGDMAQPCHVGPFPCDIPAGSRVVIRAMCEISDATDRLFDAVGYGFSEHK